MQWLVVVGFVSALNILGAISVRSEDSLASRYAQAAAPSAPAAERQLGYKKAGPAKKSVESNSFRKDDFLDPDQSRAALLAIDSACAENKSAYDFRFVSLNCSRVDASCSVAFYLLPKSDATELEGDEFTASYQKITLRGVCRIPETKKFLDIVEDEETASKVRLPFYSKLDKCITAIAADAERGETQPVEQP